MVPFAQICAFVLLVSTMLGLREWSDDLNVVLFEFLEDDTKLAQSCTDWLYVQHWYTVVPEPSMRVTLWALMGVGDDPLLSHVSVVPCVFVLCVLPTLPDSDKKVSFFFRDGLKVLTQGDFCAVL